MVQQASVVSDDQPGATGAVADRSHLAHRSIGVTAVNAVPGDVGLAPDPGGAGDEEVVVMDPLDLQDQFGVLRARGDGRRLLAADQT